MNPKLRRRASARTKYNADVPDLRKLRQARAREASIEELGKISHFENLLSGERVDAARARELDRKQFMSVGFSYAEILQRIRTRLPRSTMSGGDLRWIASMIRSGVPPFDKGSLPRMRVRSRWAAFNPSKPKSRKGKRSAHRRRPTSAQSLSQNG